MKVMIITPSEYIGTVMELVQAKRGEMGEMTYLSPERVELHYRCRWPRSSSTSSTSSSRAPVDTPRSTTNRRLPAVRPRRVDILLNGSRGCVLDDRPQGQGLHVRQAMVEEAPGAHPRQLFDVPIQAAIGSRIISRETVKAKRKDVTAKCYGGDITRKRKLLERQKEGKKRMKMVGIRRGPPGGLRGRAQDQR